MLVIELTEEKTEKIRIKINNHVNRTKCDEIIKFKEE